MTDTTSTTVRADGRSTTDLRPVTIETGWSAHAEGNDPSAGDREDVTVRRLHKPADARASTGRVVRGGVNAGKRRRHRGRRQADRVVDRLLDGPVRPTGSTPTGPKAACAEGLVESARGATLCIVERDGDRLTRVHLRTGAYANWPSVAYAASDNLLPDFPLINKSFELCYACADR